MMVSQYSPISPQEYEGAVWVPWDTPKGEVMLHYCHGVKTMVVRKKHWRYCPFCGKRLGVE